MKYKHSRKQITERWALGPNFTSYILATKEEAKKEYVCVGCGGTGEKIQEKVYQVVIDESCYEQITNNGDSVIRLQIK